MNRYETNSKGQAPALSEIMNEFATMPRSSFDLSHQKIFDGGPYAIIPFDSFLMFPNSEMYINYNVDCITKNPFIKRLLSAASIEIRTYVCKCSDLWEGWNNFVTKGRSGKLNMQIPAIKFLHYNSGSPYCHTLLPYNPSSYLNIFPPIEFETSQSFKNNQGFVGINQLNHSPSDLTALSDLTNTATFINNVGGVSALPFVMYTKIAKEYFNSNLLQNNPYWYPENENHDLILPYSIPNPNKVTTACYDYPQAEKDSTVDGTALTWIQPTNNKASMPWLNVLYYRQRKGNYFTTSSPFPDLIRGDVPTLDIMNAFADFTDTSNYRAGTFTASSLGLVAFNEQSDGMHIVDGYPDDSGVETVKIHNTNNEGHYTFHDSSDQSITKRFTNTSGLNKAIMALNNNVIRGISLNAKLLRNVLTLTVFKERMARTDGSYNEMIQAQFKFNPRWHEHKPIYCGGHYQQLVFSEVVQQSADANSPLGTTAGRGVSSATSKTIKVSSNDYSIMMSVLTVTPDDFYTQGIKRMWSELTQIEQYFPILNNLNPQAIKNKELYISGNANTDENVFGYAELFSHFKSEQNEVAGLLSLPISKVGDTGAYLFNRLFVATPQLNNYFVTGELSSNENLVFSSTEQAQFVFRISCFKKYIAPMPAITTPSDFGLSY